MNTLWKVSYEGKILGTCEESERFDLIKNHAADIELAENEIDYTKAEFEIVLSEK